MKMFWPMQVCALLCSAHFARYNAVEVMQSKSTMVFSVMASKLGNPFPRDRWGREVTQQEVTTLFFASSGIPSVTPPIRPALLIWMFPSHTDTHTETPLLATGWPPACLVFCGLFSLRDFSFGFNSWYVFNCLLQTNLWSSKTDKQGAAQSMLGNCLGLAAPLRPTES